MAIVKMAVKDCEGCPAKCCSDIEAPILRPRSRFDVDNLKWQVSFGNINVFIRNKRWYTLTLGKCMYLDKNFRCSIYETRPSICRDHNPPECEQYGEIYDVIFETPDELEKFYQKEVRKRRRKAKAKKANS